MSNEKKEVCLKIKCYCGTGYAGVDFSGTVGIWVYEDDDDKTREDKKQQAAEQWLHDQIEFTWDDAEDQDEEPDEEYD